jgi:hypothetical protein
MHEPVDLTNERTEILCKMGQGAATCSFLAMNRGFVCLKGSPLEMGIHERRAQKSMTAMGDNCSGPPDFKPTEEGKLVE